MLSVRPIARVLAVAALCGSVAAQSTTWIVDDDGPADFNDLQAAVDVAGDGDVILVREGIYRGVRVVAKSLVIQGEVGSGSVEVQGELGLFTEATSALVVRDLAPGQSLRIRGLDFRRFAFPDGYATDVIDVRNNLGAIVLEDVTSSTSGSAGAPLDARDCASLTLLRCEFVASAGLVLTLDGMFLGTIGYAGAGAIRSNLFVYDSIVSGGAGWISGVVGTDVVAPGPGFPGIVSLGGSLLVSGSVVSGGDGGVVSGTSCHPGSDGGPAIRVDAWNEDLGDATLTDNVLVAGAATAGACGLPDGTVPPAVEIGTASVLELVGAARSLAIASPVVSGTSTTLDFGGEAGEVLALAIAVDAAPGVPLLPGFAFVSHLADGITLLFPGTVGADGTLALDLGWTPTVQTLRLSAQAVFLDGVGAYASGPSTLVALGSGG